MNVIDWILVGLLALYCLSGYWQGFIAGASAVVGLLLGAVVGFWLAPILLGDSAPSVWISLGALATVLVCATVGQASFQYVGTKLRDKIRWQPVRAVDALGGAALSVVAVLVVAWMLGLAVTGSQIRVLSVPVNNSLLLGKVNAAMPTQARELLGAFDKLVGSSVFPRYLEPFAPERIVEANPAPRGVLRDPDIARARDSVFKITGAATCGNNVEGSGFLYAPERVMTNAHVVAGVSQPNVQVGGQQKPARVVYYDANMDIAVLAVPGVSGPTLKFSDDGKQGQVAAVLGYPENGPYDAQPARIRSEQRLRSANIYNEGTVSREVFSLRSLVRQGNSGGPLVATDGRVIGVIFAASVSNSNTGYALTTNQVKDAAQQAIHKSGAVNTGGCA